MSDYGFAKTLTDTTFDQAVSRVTEALAAEGFGVLTEIDVRATLKEKLGVEFPRYEILGACNPPLAHQALQAEPDVGLLLPCNVVVRELGSGGEVVVEALDPVVQMEVADSAALSELAGDVRSRLERALEQVARSEAP